MRNPDKLLELAAEMEKPMERYLKWRQVLNRLDRGRKTVLAKIMAGLREDKESMASVEQRAYAHPEFEAYLEEWDKTEKEMVKAQVEYENLKNNFEAYQSALSYDRESMKRNM